MAKDLPKDPARLRQLVARNEQARTRQLETLLAARRRMLRGSFVVLGKKCGKPNCSCAQGEALHPARYLAAYEGGTKRMVYVRPEAAAAVKVAAERYQRFRRARAAVVKLSARTLELTDRLQKMLSDPLPPRSQRSVRGQSEEEEGGGGGGGGGGSGERPGRGER